MPRTSWVATGSSAGAISRAGAGFAMSGQMLQQRVGAAGVAVLTTHQRAPRSLRRRAATAGCELAVPRAAPGRRDGDLRAAAGRGARAGAAGGRRLLRRRGGRRAPGPRVAGQRAHRAGAGAGGDQAAAATVRARLAADRRAARRGAAAALVGDDGPAVGPAGAGDDRPRLDLRALSGRLPARGPGRAAAGGARRGAAIAARAGVLLL